MGQCSAVPKCSCVATQGHGQVEFRSPRYAAATQQRPRPEIGFARSLCMVSPCRFTSSSGYHYPGYLSFLGGKSENEAFRSVSGVFLLKNQLKGPNKALENLGFGRDTLRRPPEAFQSQQTAHLTPIQPHFQTRVTLARCTYIGLNQRRANALHM